MKCFIYYLVVLTLCLPSLDGGVLFDVENDKIETRVKTSNINSATQDNILNPEHLDEQEKYSYTANQYNKHSSSHDCHDCCDEGNSLQLMHCCDDGCANCSNDCSNGGFALLAENNYLFPSSSNALISNILQQPLSASQSQLRPPIS